MSNFKDNLSELLKINEIDVQDFLERLDLNKNFLYDTDKHSTLLDSAIKVANELRLSIDYLCDRKILKETETKTRSGEKFLTNLLATLKQLKISQRRFCKDLNFSSSCFTRWRKGSLPYLNTVIEIADYLDCQIDDLLI